MGQVGPHMLCTKSPKRLRYADSLEGPAVGFESSGPSDLPLASERDDRRFLTPSCDCDAVLIAVDSAVTSRGAWEWE